RTKRRRRLGAPQGGTIDRFADKVVADPFDRIRDRSGQDGAPILCCSINTGVDLHRLYQWPGSIMHKHDVGARWHSANTVCHGFLSAAAALHNGQDLWPIAGGDEFIHGGFGMWTDDDDNASRFL